MLSSGKDALKSIKFAWDSDRSIFVPSKIRGFFTRVGENSSNSRNKVGKAAFQCSSERSTRKARQAVLAICFRKRSPNPAPSCAPSIMPGISAKIISLSLTVRTPKFGIFVVKGYGAIFGRAFVKYSSKLDFPAFGNPTSPISAMRLSSTLSFLSCPGCPG
ncbi:MAG: hypothetical protein BWX44_01298 [Spirochaetes bacterium ADurb.Bin001]|nr:MAG: hypothetical protein BWX44_01298 [Spirochaetes bacterium ADurb.Bin001]